jgi:ubiquinone/menaquinone biosynthesis C-methylase UbiE
MRLLDCGCGVGSITIDLAEIVAPGQVVGIDRDASQLEVARKLAAERSVTNVTFEVGNVYELGYPEAWFDAVLAHTILVHLTDRLRALREMRRVLRPSGVIAVSDDDYSTFVSSPPDSIAQQFIDLWAKYLIRNGGDPYYSRHLRRLLEEAGFAETEGHAVAADYYGMLAETRRAAGLSQILSRETKP